MKKITDFMQAIPKNIKILIIAVLSIIVLVGIVKLVNHKKPAPVEAAPVEEVQPVEAPAPVVKKVYKAPTTAPVSGNLSYQDALAAYKGRVLQFNANCQTGVISSAAIKVGTKLMLDNRSANPAKIVLDGTTYNIGAYGWEVATLNKVGTFTPSCNTQQNVHTIVVEK